MPFLLIPLLLFVGGLILMMVIMLGVTLVRVLFWPVVLGLFIWWLVRRSDHSPRHPHEDWQDHLRQNQHARREAHHVTETTVHKEKPAAKPEQPTSSQSHDDDWSDF
ncbi:MULTISPECIES: hypothetical protein [Lacticaseibacillus]|uniref:Phage shock protein G n=2 Tax=Lacticaseibacillus TaxID=2759736 RepID=A0ABW4CJ80_9LACO|nr:MULTISPECIES: hypothetical protein [Lacticaseibacillus]